MRTSLLTTLICLMIAFAMSMVPALAQTSFPNVTGRDWVWIIIIVALVAAAIWFAMRSGRQA